MITRRRQDITMERKRIPVREKGDRRRGEGRGVRESTAALDAQVDDVE